MTTAEIDSIIAAFAALADSLDARLDALAEDAA
jgi:hypothetical protein